MRPALFILVTVIPFPARNSTVTEKTEKTLGTESVMEAGMVEVQLLPAAAAVVSSRLPTCPIHIAHGTGVQA